MFRSSIVQEWEGVVKDIGPATFSASLVDVTSGSSTTENREFPLDLIRPPDAKKLRKGAMFWWRIVTMPHVNVAGTLQSIGSEGGPKQEGMVLSMHLEFNPPHQLLSDKEIDDAKIWANELVRIISETDREQVH